MAYESDRITQRLNDLVSSQELYMNLIAFDELNLAEQALIGTWELANEVYNGGFTQYFHNSSRDHAKPMVAVLRLIGADCVATILEKAIALAGPGTRWGAECNYLAALKLTPEEVRESVKDLERDLYNELDSLHHIVFRYLSKHRDQIDTPSDFWTELTIQ